LLLHPTISITGGFELHPSIFKKKKAKKMHPNLPSSKYKAQRGKRDEVNGREV
jgi:hypothetical protein